MRFQRNATPSINREDEGDRISFIFLPIDDDDVVVLLFVSSSIVCVIRRAASVADAKKAKIAAVIGA